MNHKHTSMRFKKVKFKKEFLTGDKMRGSAFVVIL